MSVIHNVLLALSLSLHLFASSVSSHFADSDAEEVLAAKLQKRLTKRSPPMGMVDNKVYLYIDLYQIVDVDERNGVLALKLWIFVYYRINEQLWEPDDFSGARRMQFPMNTFWQPDVAPLDAIEVKYESYNYQTVSYDGSVAAWSSLVTIRSSCNFNVTHFPMDRHTCGLKFGQWVFDVTSYTIGTDPEFDISDEVDLAFYKEHDQWKLERPLRITFDNRTFKNVFNYSDMHLNIRLQRHPKFYLIVFIIPSILLYILCPLVFLLPVDSGEKTSMSITLLLAQVVSLGGLSEVLPASSTQFPIVSYYMALTIIHMGVVTVFSIIVINIHGLEGCHSCPQWLRKTLSSRYLYVICMTPCTDAEAGMHPVKNIRSNQVSPEPLTNLYQGETPVPKDGIVLQERRVSGTVPKNKANLANENGQDKNVVNEQSEETMQRLWKRFSVFLDRILFIVNFLSAVIMTIVFTIWITNP